MVLSRRDSCRPADRGFSTDSLSAKAVDAWHAWVRKARHKPKSDHYPDRERSDYQQVIEMVGPNGLEPLSSTVSVLKMGIAVMSSSSVPGSIHAGFNALAHLFR